MDDEEIKLLREMNQELLDEIELLRKNIESLESLAFGPDEWYTDGEDFEEDEDE